MSLLGSGSRALAGLAAVALAPVAVTRAATFGALHPAASAALTPADAALVLGARVWEDGRPSRFLRERVEVAVSLYKRGLVPAIIMTGADDNREGLDEVASMVRTAIELGVPERDIIRDGQGLNTRASAVNARQTLGLGSVIVCTQEFHLPRAVFLCQVQGLKAQGAYPRIHVKDHTVRGYVREVPATWKALLIEGIAVTAKTVR
jgi:vancomycin permeability regulator SanA